MFDHAAFYINTFLSAFKKHRSYFCVTAFSNYYIDVRMIQV